MILLDSNLLLRLADSASPQRLIARRAISILERRGEQLIIVPQNAFEFWAVATRPAGKLNGLGMPTDRVELWLNHLQRRFMMRHDTEALVPTWRRLVAGHRTIGFRAHDARLVAAMQVHGIDRILTFNVQDFRDYPIAILEPTTIQ